MECNEKLRKACTDACRGCAASSKRRQDIESRWDHYSLAVKLASVRNGDPDRTAHWERRAREHQEDLYKLVGKRMW